jgi:hypothetical protein
MALTQKPALALTVEYMDETGSPGKSVFHLAAATTLAAAKTAADALITQLLAASDCTIVGYSIGASVAETAPVAPAAGSRVENKALLKFRTAAGKVSTISIPGIKAAAVAQSGGIVSTDTDVAAIVATLTAAPWTDSNGSLLTHLYSDEQVFRSTRKRQFTTDISPAS